MDNYKMDKLQQVLAVMVLAHNQVAGLNVFHNKHVHLVYNKLAIMLRKLVIVV